MGAHKFIHACFLMAPGYSKVCYRTRAENQVEPEAEDPAPGL